MLFKNCFRNTINIFTFFNVRHIPDSIHFYLQYKCHIYMISCLYTCSLREYIIAEILINKSTNILTFELQK